MASSSAEQLLEETRKVPFRGWDFSVLGERVVVEPPPWSFEQLVYDEAARAASMLDMGTGGGEWLSQRAGRSHRRHRELAAQRFHRRRPATCTPTSRMSWLVRSDVDAGRDELNFSEWDRDHTGSFCLGLLSQRGIVEVGDRSVRR